MSTPYPTTAGQPLPGPVPRPTEGLAIASLVCSLLGFNVIAVILGHVALRRIRATGAGGYGLAVAGLVIGYLTLAAILITVLVAGGLTVWAIMAGNGGA